jgi:hypothetical protein
MYFSAERAGGGGSESVCVRLALGRHPVRRVGREYAYRSRTAALTRLWVNHALPWKLRLLHRGPLDAESDPLEIASETEENRGTRCDNDTGAEFLCCGDIHLKMYAVCYAETCLSTRCHVPESLPY